MDNRIFDGLPILGSDAARLGLSPKGLRQLLHDHRLRRIFRGVYVDAAVADTRTLRSRALHLVMPPHGVLYGCSAAWALGVDAFPPAQRFNFTPTCVVPHGTTRCTSAYVCCLEGYLPREEIMTTDGLRLTVPVRTTVDMLRRLRRPYALSAADVMAHAELVSVSELMAYIVRLKRFPGIVQARELVVLVEPRAESSGESWERLRIIDAGFPRPEPQYVVRDHRGRKLARLDHAYPHIRVAAEYDGAEYHSHHEDASYDEERRAYLRKVLGWHFVVAGKKDILGKDDSFEVELGQLLGLVPLLPRQW